MGLSLTEHRVAADWVQYFRHPYPQAACSQSFLFLFLCDTNECAGFHTSRYGDPELRLLTGAAFVRYFPTAGPAFRTGLTMTCNPPDRLLRHFTLKTTSPKGKPLARHPSDCGLLLAVKRQNLFYVSVVSFLTPVLCLNHYGHRSRREISVNLF